MKHSVNMNDWLIWEQNASPMFLTMTLNAGMRPLRKYFGMSLWTSVIVFEENQGRWLFRPAELKLLGQKMIDFLMCPPYRVSFETSYETIEKDVRQRAQEIQFNSQIANLTLDNLVDVFEDYCALYYEWYKYGWFCEPVQFRGQDILTNYFEKEFDSNQPEINISNAKQAIYTIDEDTFNVEILKHLVECAKKLAIVLKRDAIRTKVNELYNDQGFEEKATDFIYSIIKADQNNETRELKSILDEHSAKFYWKCNNYFSTDFVTARKTLNEILSQEDFNTENPARHFEAEIKSIRENKSKLLSIKSDFLKILPAYHQNIAALLNSIGGILLDKRKRTIMIANSAFDYILNVIAEKTATDISDCRLLIPQELRSFIAEPREYSDRFQERRKQFLVMQGDFPLNNELVVNVIEKSEKHDLSFNALLMEEPFITEGSQVEKSLGQLNTRLDLFTNVKLTDLHELQGVTTYFNSAEPYISGIVKVIKNPKKDSLNKDEILVAPSTTPDYMESILRCKAIITDWGGQTSHAAITSRELKKPCIIGTNFASQILKNGDKVQMNLSQGTIEVIK